MVEKCKQIPQFKITLRNLTGGENKEKHKYNIQEAKENAQKGKIFVCFFFYKKIRFKVAYPFQEVIVGMVCQVLYQMLPKLVKLNYKLIRLGNHLYLGAEMIL